MSYYVMRQHQTESCDIP